jgi:Uma2 family endonuclease
MTTSLDTAGWPDRLLILADWQALPGDELHDVECSEGVLHVAPKPFPVHQRIARRLAAQLEDQLPAELAVETDCEVILAEVPLTVRAPDLVVVDAAAFDVNPPRFTPAAVHLAVEVVSEGSRQVDRVLKPAQYAEAGIPAYWIIEPASPISLTTHLPSPEARGYRRIGEYHGISRIELAGHTLRLDLDRLGEARP